MRRDTRSDSVVALADRLRISDRTLRRWLVDLPGLTVARLISWRRVLTMTRLLATTDMGLDTASVEAGLSGSADFHRRFRRLVGRPSHQFQRRVIHRVALDAFYRTLRNATATRSRGAS